jgi:hypothetical protein
MNLEKLWNYIGDCGVFSESPTVLASNFDVFECRKIEGKKTLFYRMHPKSAKQPKVAPTEKEDKPKGTHHPWFIGVKMHDPMECFITREEERDDNVHVMHLDCEVLENSHSITYDEFLALCPPVI